MREISVAEQRYEVVRAVLADGETVTDVAARFGVRGRRFADGRVNLYHFMRGVPREMHFVISVAHATRSAARVSG